MGFSLKISSVCYTVTTDQAKLSSSTQGSEKTFTISEKDYVKFLSYQTANHASLPSASLAQKRNAMVCLSTSSNSDSWIIDSGATDHMLGMSRHFSNIQESTPFSHVALTDGSTIKVKGLGTI